MVPPLQGGKIIGHPTQGVALGYHIPPFQGGPSLRAHVAWVSRIHPRGFTLARALLNERLALKPQSQLNRAWRERVGA